MKIQINSPLSGTVLSLGTKFIGVNFASGTVLSLGTKFIGVNFASGTVPSSGTKFIGVNFASGTVLSLGTKSTLSARLSPNMHAILFGENFFQDSSVIKINKADLPGLTATANNTAESLLAALIIRNLKILGSNKISYSKIDIEFWGCRFAAGEKICTLLIHLFNRLSITNDYEIVNYNAPVDPMNY